MGVRGSIAIAPMATNIAVADDLGKRNRRGSLVAIGRLTPSKRYDHAIRALADLLKDHAHATLTLVGDGRDRERLQALADSLGVAHAVKFAGRVSESEKLRILDRSDVLIGTSVREGWGLTITEAAARGTPAVVYDVPGFRDAVVPGRTGLHVEPDPAALAAAIRGLLADGSRYEDLRRRAWESVEDSTYDPAANTFELVLRDVLSRGD
jgi:glycosyltransferase involved in cell wall biosynthesis